MSKQINIGGRVTFDDPTEGPQSGTVIGLLPNISNGQKTAVVEVDFALPGVVWNVPTIYLKSVKAFAP
jgi:hypothetical protein